MDNGEITSVEHRDPVPSLLEIGLAKLATKQFLSDQYDSTAQAMKSHFDSGYLPPEHGDESY